MDCPICGGNGELDFPTAGTDTASNTGDRTFGRECVGNTVTTCYRCNGSGYLEDSDN